MLTEGTEYGNKRDYKKIEIFHKGKYVATTSWAKTAKEAKERYLRAHPEHHASDIMTDFKPLKEEAEQIDELSKSTLKSYAKQATGSLSRTAHEGGFNTARMIAQNHPIIAKKSSIFHFDPKADQDVARKRRNRNLGINTAIDKLTKEETEQIDELSKNTLGSYVKKSASSVQKHSAQLGYYGAKRGVDNRAMAAQDKSKVSKRITGIKHATNRLMKEELMKEERGPHFGGHEANYQPGGARAHSGFGSQFSSTYAGEGPEARIKRRGGNKNTLKQHGYKHTSDNKENPNRPQEIFTHPSGHRTILHPAGATWAHYQKNGDHKYGETTADLAAHLEKVHGALKEERDLQQSRALASKIRSKIVKKQLNKASKEKKENNMHEQFAPICDFITLIANQQPGEATPIFNDLMGARVLDAMQGYKQEIAQTLFAPTADNLSEETEQIDELSKRTLKRYIGNAVPDLAHHAGMSGYYTGKPMYRTSQLRDNTSQAMITHIRKEKTRSSGISRAASKLEESEQLDEMSTRKDFQQVADVIKAHPSAAKRKELATHHAGIFKAQNPRFDHKRFFAAANAGEPGV